MSENVDPFAVAPLGDSSGAHAPPRTTRADWAENRLRTAIVTGELRPGERIRIEQLATRWDVSPTPLREAVRALGQAGLVELSPQRSATVSRLSLREICDIYELRLLLEPRALRKSLNRRSWQWRADVEAAWAELQRAWADPEARSENIEPSHTQFHQALAGACDNQELLRTTARLSTQSIRIRLLAIEHRGGVGPTIGEHVDLYRACVEGTVDEAMRLGITHIARTITATVGSAALAEIAERIGEAGGADTLLPEVIATLLAESSVPVVETKP